MSNTKKMLEYLRSEGLQPTEESFGITFRYQMKNFVYFNNDEDPEFFQLVMPAIYDVNDENRDFVYRAMDKMNAGVKVAKASLVNDESVWLYCEMLIDSTPVFSDLVPRALRILQHAYNQFGE